MIFNFFFFAFAFADLRGGDYSNIKEIKRGLLLCTWLQDHLVQSDANPVVGVFGNVWICAVVVWPQ